MFIEIIIDKINNSKKKKTQTKKRTKHLMNPAFNSELFNLQVNSLNSELMNIASSNQTAETMNYLSKIIHFI